MNIKSRVLTLSSKLRPPRREKTVHELLSAHQSAYAIFLPKPDTAFHLFEIIFLNPDRSAPPYNSTTNLQDVIRELHTEQESLANLFEQQFEQVRHREDMTPPVVSTVTEEALHGAGMHLSAVVKKGRPMYRQLRLSSLFSDDYTGRAELQSLLWEHAETLFPMILRKLQTEHPAVEGEKRLMGIVTKRLISNVGVSRVDEQGRQGGFRFGAWKKGPSEVFDDLYGVSGLHFIAFPFECLDNHRWRVYKGFHVSDSEMDEDTNPDLTRRDDFYRAGRWMSGEGNLASATGSESKTVSHHHSA